MLLGLLLAACTDPGSCPTRAEIEHAIEAHRQMLEGYINHIEGEAHPDSTATVTLPRPRRVTDISCARPGDKHARALECRFTLHYADSRERRTETLAMIAGRWRIIQARP